MTSSIAITVLGEPAPQGSKTRAGAGMRESNPATAPWRATVTAAALKAIGDRPQLTGPLELQATFVFARPTSHYGTGRNANVLKPNAPAYRWTKPDLDKLLRAIGDALTGVAYRDDARIAIVRAEKHYGDGPAYAHIVLSELEPEEANSEL